MTEEKLARAKKPVWITIPDDPDEDPRDFEYALVTDTKEERGANLSGGESNYRFMIPIYIEITRSGVTMVDYSENYWSVHSDDELKWATFEDPDEETLREAIKFIFERIGE